MKNLFILLCIVIMFFGVAGCPGDDNPVNPTTMTHVSKPLADNTNGNGSFPIGGDGNTLPIEGNTANHSAVPEPATLILLGTGLVGLAGYGRKRFMK